MLLFIYFLPEYGIICLKILFRKGYEHMKLLEALVNRHSVRQYLERPLEKNIISALNAEIRDCNRSGNLHIQLVVNEPKVFKSPLAHYGNFRGVTNYIALIGPKKPTTEEACGYYGERLVLKAQQLGLNTCWVALTYKKIPNTFKIEWGEKLIAVIALGYGQTQGSIRKSKSAEAVSNINENSPDWFRKGVAAALLAPTAVNQQKFYLSQEADTVFAKAQMGFYTKVDLGIVKYHFEIGAGKNNFKWM